MAIQMPETPQPLHGDIGEDYNIRTIVSVALIGFLTLILAVIWLKAIWARADRWEWEHKIVAAPFSDLVDLRTAQRTRLAEAEWSDPAKNKVSEPLSLAEPAVLSQLRQDQAQFEAQNRKGSTSAAGVPGQVPALPVAAPGLTPTAPATGSAPTTTTPATPATPAPPTTAPQSAPAGSAPATNTTTPPGGPAGSPVSPAAKPANPAAPASPSGPAAKPGKHHRTHSAASQREGQVN